MSCGLAPPVPVPVFPSQERPGRPYGLVAGAWGTRFFRLIKV
jgi:hypothetical protein